MGGELLADQQKKKPAHKFDGQEGGRRGVKEGSGKAKNRKRHRRGISATTT